MRRSVRPWNAGGGAIKQYDMKIINDILQDAVKTEQTAKAQAPREQRFVGSERRVRGHILFEYNTQTGEITQAGLKREVELDTEGNPVYKTKVYRKPGCLYIQALNAKNALKKVRRSH